MTKYVAANTSTTIHVEFNTVDGNNSVPSAATYSLYDNERNIVDGLDTVAIPLGSPPTTEVFLQLPPSANVKVRPYEVRYLEVIYTIDGVQYTQNGHYQIIDSLYIPVTEDDVRAVLGALGLPDAYIDIFSAYYEVQQALPGFNLKSIIENGVDPFPIILELIKLKSAINSSHGVRTSMMQSEQSDNTLYRRFENMDVEGILDDLMARYLALLESLTGVTTTLDYRISVMTQDTDYITGA